MPTKKLLYPIIILFLISVPFFLGKKFAEVTLGRPVIAEAGTPQKFEYLAKQRSNFCARLRLEELASYPKDSRLQGSCCSPINLHRYQEQVKELKKYQEISPIPPDPYDIPVSLASELLGYKNSIQLTADQQEIYEQAMKLSEEGGPCCCRCWRWDAFEGLAKFLITQYNFSADQVAEVWDLEDGCGGEGHEHTT